MANKINELEQALQDEKIHSNKVQIEYNFLKEDMEYEQSTNKHLKEMLEDAVIENDKAST